MDHLFESDAVPIRICGTDNMLEYFKDMRDMNYFEFMKVHSFYPLWFRVRVFPDDIVAQCDGDGIDGLESVIALLESLPEEYHLWESAVSVRMYLGNRELYIELNTEYDLKRVRTAVDISV